MKAILLSSDGGKTVIYLFVSECLNTLVFLILNSQYIIKEYYISVKKTKIVTETEMWVCDDAG